MQQATILIFVALVFVVTLRSPSSSQLITYLMGNNDLPLYVVPSRRLAETSPPSQARDQIAKPQNTTPNLLKETDTYGWTAAILPVPFENPNLCGISNLSLPFNISSEHLLLCDPDGVVRTEAKIEVARAISNFTKTFPGKVYQKVTKDHTDCPHRRLLRSTALDVSSSQAYFGQAFVGWWDHVMGQLFGMNSSKNHTSHLENTTNCTALPIITKPYTIGVAVVEKMDLQAVLQQGYYYTYQDQNQMVSDASQLFAQEVHHAWWTAAQTDCFMNNRTNCPTPEYGILIFISVQDRVCFISTGTEASYFLPWWRLGNVVWSMRPELQRNHYGKAIAAAVADLTIMLESGPPSMSSRLRDFLSRFGVVLGFAVVTFLFGAWGEYRDRRKRWQYAERLSNMTAAEKDKAVKLQKEFRTRACPICLENFDGSEDSVCVPVTGKDEPETETSPLTGTETTPLTSSDTAGLRPPSTDDGEEEEEGEFEIPTMGNDGQPIKMLRCGHIFDETCWKQWVNSGQGNPCICPVCRQDVGGSEKPEGALPPAQQHPSYNSLGQSRRSRGFFGFRRHIRGLRTDTGPDEDEEAAEWAPAAQDESLRPSEEEDAPEQEEPRRDTTY